MSRLPSGLISEIPTALAALSKALARAFRDLLLECVRAVTRVFEAIWNWMYRLFQKLWAAYIRVESRIASLVCDVLLTIYAFRFFAVIVGIGIALAFWHWLAVTVYVLFITSAIVFYFKPNDQESREAREANQRYRTWLTPIIQWVLRLGVAAIAFVYFNRGEHPRLASLNSTVLQNRPPSTIQSEPAVARPTLQTAQQDQKKVPVLAPQASRSPAASPSTAIAVRTGGETAINSGTSLSTENNASADAGVFRVSQGITPPEVLYKIDPSYSDEARQAKASGTVVLYVEVDQTGHARNLRVVKGIGLGLDEKAIEAVNKWRFKPGLKNGKPVIVAAHIEVNFRLLY
jgi:TonB family protein